MGAGPTPAAIRRAHKNAVTNMAKQAGRLADVMPYFGGKGMDYHGVVGTVTIRSRLIRASNGEASLWATATSPKGSLLDAPWMSGGCTPEAIASQLI